MVTNENTKFEAVLRIHSKILSIEEITDSLNHSPSRAIVKGSKADPNNPNSYVRKTNTWQLDSDLDSTEPLEDHILRLVQFVETKETHIKEISKNCEFDIYCGFFAGDFTGYIALSPSLIRRLTILPIEIMIHLYPPLDSDD